MAKIKNNPPLLKGISDIQDALFSANTGLSRTFVEKNDQRIQISNAAIANMLQGFGYGVVGNNTNSISELANIVQQTISQNRRNTTFINPPDEDVSGIRMISPMGNVDMAEQEIISSNAVMFQSFLNTASEYRGVVELIPEVKRAIENIVRDIVNVSDLTNKAFNNVYVDKFNRSVSQKDKDADERKNKIILDEIVEKNKLEIKFKRWLFESATAGVKPVAFIPYSYIFRQLQNTLNQRFGFRFTDYQQKIKKGESFSLFKPDDKKRSEEFYRLNIEGSLRDCVRNSPKVQARESAEGLTYESLLKDILNDDIVSSYAASVEADLQYSIESVNYQYESLSDTKQKRLFTGAESGEISKLDDDLDLFKKLSSNYKDKQEKIKNLSKEEKLRLARQGLTEFVEYIDNHIKVPKRESSGAVLADKILREKDRYDALYDLGKDYKIAENLKKEGYSNPNEIKEDTIGAFDVKSSLGKECLIVPYAPESVIPININGEYLGFYALEYEYILGENWKNRRRVGSFTDYIKQQGIGDDSMLLTGGAALNTYGGTDPLENNLYSPLSTYNYNMSTYLNGSMNNITEDKRFDMMKTVVLRVLAHRLHDPDLIDNKMFKDAVMHLLRSDILVKNKIQFTYIPPEYMCYMTWKTDDSGVPVSILSGTLYDCYLHIASKTASGAIKLLKSGDKEKYEINVGLNKEMGYTVDELQRLLSTRSVYSPSMFSNLSTVLKVAGNYQRLIIPVMNNNKLYDVTQIEHVNDLSPDDEFTNQRLQSILSKIYFNNGTFSELDNVDFAKQFFTRNLEYSSCIKEGQFNYNPYGTKMLRILSEHSNLPTYNSIVEDIKQNVSKYKQNVDNQNDILQDNIKDDIDNENSIDLACIELLLAMPSYLQMLTITDSINTAKEMATAIVESYGTSGGNALDEAVNNTFKLKLIKKFTTNIDWATVDTFRQEAIAEGKAVAAEQVKTNTIDEHIQNPQNSQTDIAEEVPEDVSGGGDTDLGSDMGSDMGDMGSDLGGGETDFGGGF